MRSVVECPCGRGSCRWQEGRGARPGRFRVLGEDFLADRYFFWSVLGSFFWPPGARNAGPFWAHFLVPEMGSQIWPSNYVSLIRGPDLGPILGTKKRAQNGPAFWAQGGPKMEKADAVWQWSNRCAAQAPGGKRPPVLVIVLGLSSAPASVLRSEEAGEVGSTGYFSLAAPTARNLC